MTLTVEDVNRLSELVSLSAICKKGNINYKSVYSRIHITKKSLDKDTSEKILATMAKNGLTYKRPKK